MIDRLTLEDRLRQMYSQEQKQGMVEIFVKLTLPVNIYETAAGLYRIADYKSFDDYVSHCVVNDNTIMLDRQDDLITDKIRAVKINERHQ